MHVPSRLLLPISLLLITALLFNGCATAIGYGIGHAVDNANESYEYVDHAYAHTIKPDSHILVLMNDGREFKARYLDADPGNSILVRRDGREELEGPLWVLLDDIKSILVIHVPDEGRHKYTAIGAVVDLLGVAVYAFFRSLADGLQALGNLS